TAEPTTPPIRAWEELDGSPNHQVIRFQAIAPIRPAKTTVGVTTAELTTSLATVAATEIEMKAPTKLSSEATPIATPGRAAPVEIEVATTLAVSWKPLVKSNASAVPTTMTKMTSELIAGHPQSSRWDEGVEAWPGKDAGSVACSARERP